MTAHARAVGRGHARLDRPRIVPNDPLPPDPLDTLVADIYEYQVEVRICCAFVAAFDRILTYQDIAVAGWGDTPEVRADSATPQTQRVIRHHIMFLNRRLKRYDKPFAVVNVRGKGYKLTDRANAPKPMTMTVTTPAKRAALVARYYELRAKHPEWKKEAVYAKLGIARQTFCAWLRRYPELSRPDAD